VRKALMRNYFVIKELRVTNVREDLIKEKR
jgi:hypothetical protein